MYHPVSPWEQVQILEATHDYEGCYAYVTGVAGDTNSLGDEIPQGWVEVRLTMDFYELFREADVLQAHLTL